jgi:anti-anti-sigma regulatory factor
MSEASAVLTRVRETLVVTFQGSCDPSTLVAASEALMDELGRRDAEGVVFEISGCEVIDIDEFTALGKLAQKVEWLGIESVISGLNPGIVAYLVSAGVTTSGLHLALDLEQALAEIDFT